jgi:hypothetical protein
MPKRQPAAESPSPKLDGRSTREGPAEPAYGYSIDGAPLTDDLIERLAAEAESDEFADRVIAAAEARRVQGDSPSVALHVRVDLFLAQALEARAEVEETSTSAIVRQALAAYLDDDRPERPRRRPAT